jgi:hypothetical protein
MTLLFRNKHTRLLSQNTMWSGGLWTVTSRKNRSGWRSPLVRCVSVDILRGIWIFKILACFTEGSNEFQWIVFEHSKHIIALIAKNECMIGHSVWILYVHDYWLLLMSIGIGCQHQSCHTELNWIHFGCMAFKKAMPHLGLNQAHCAPKPRIMYWGQLSP